MNDNDPLRNLLVDANQVNREAIADALSGIVALEAGTGNVFLQPSYSKLDAKRKLIAILLARKAAFLLELIDTEGINATQVIAESGLPSGTVHPTLKGLREGRLALQDASRAYYIPNPQVTNAIDALMKSRP
jgi:hypothetical protein